MILIFGCWKGFKGEGELGLFGFNSRKYRRFLHRLRPVILSVFFLLGIALPGVAKPFFSPGAEINAKESTIKVSYELKEAARLGNLSVKYQASENWEAAEQAWEEGHRILMKYSPHDSSQYQRVFAIFRDIKGMLELQSGKPDEALKYFQEAEKIYKSIPENTFLLRNRVYQSLTYYKQGRQLESFRTILPVVKDLQNQQDSLLKGLALRSLGNTLRMFGNSKEVEEIFPTSLKGIENDEPFRYLHLSRELLTKSRDIALKFNSIPDVREAVQGLAETETELYKGHVELAGRSGSKDDQRMAEESYQKALDLYQKLSRDYGSSFYGLKARLKGFDLKVRSKPKPLHWNRDLQDLSRNIAQLENLKYRSILTLSFSQLVYTSYKQGFLTLSELESLKIPEILEEAIQIAKQGGDQVLLAQFQGLMGQFYQIEQQFANALQWYRQATLNTEKAALYRTDSRRYYWLWQVGKVYRKQGKFKDAVASYQNSLNVLAKLRNDLLSLPNPDAQFSFRDDVEEVYRDYVDFLLSQPMEGETQYPSNKMLGLGDDFNRFDEALKQIEELQLAELENYLRCSLDRKDTVLLSEFIQKKNLNAAIAYPIMLHDRLQVIWHFPKLGIKSYPPVLISSKALRKSLDSIQERLENKEDPGTEANSPFRQLYQWLIPPETEADLTQTGVDTIVFVADGDLKSVPFAALLNQDDQFLIDRFQVVTNVNLNLLPANPLQTDTMTVLAAGVSEARHQKSALPHVKEELEYIRQHIPQSQVLLNKAFTTQSLQKSIVNRPYQVVHLATHGEFNSIPERTVIYPYDHPINILQLQGILENRSDRSAEGIELLILSACQTAKGDRRAALGIAGVSVRAQARTAIASLTNINDSSTAKFMNYFYEALKEPGMTRGKAFQKAIHKLKKQKPLLHYWAPFVLVGNWL